MANLNVESEWKQWGGLSSRFSGLTAHTPLFRSSLSSQKGKLNLDTSRPNTKILFRYCLASMGQIIAREKKTRKGLSPQ